MNTGTMTAGTSIEIKPYSISRGSRSTSITRNL